MTLTDYFKTVVQVFKEIAPAVTSGAIIVALLSCVLFGVQMYFSLTQGLFSVGAAVFQSVHLHRLFMFPFYHRSSAQLLLNITALLFLSSSLEKGVGTVRFLFLFLLMSTTTGLCFSFLDLLQDDSSRSHAEGLLPVVLASVALTAMHTKMTKGFLCGVSFPTMALPWVLLIITTAVIPHSVLLCNVTSILIGWMYGKGWFSHVDMSEARAGIVEKMMPFRWLRRISGVMFVPASTEERRKTLLPQINPTPGSYPVQAYAPLSNINTAPMTYEGWANSASALAGPPPPLIFMDSGWYPSKTNWQMTNLIFKLLFVDSLPHFSMFKCYR
uniref:Rhomboid domain containing 2 n=1 Tax=Mastacembelus armatus TaxID=205130 RepID=A0A3Q3KYK3_9TELE